MNLVALMKIYLVDMQSGIAEKYINADFQVFTKNGKSYVATGELVNVNNQKQSASYRFKNQARCVRLLTEPNQLHSYQISLARCSRVYDITSSIVNDIIDYISETVKENLYEKETKDSQIPVVRMMDGKVEKLVGLESVYVWKTQRYGNPAVMET